VAAGSSISWRTRRRNKRGNKPFKKNDYETEQTSISGGNQQAAERGKEALWQASLEAAGDAPIGGGERH